MSFFHKIRDCFKPNKKPQAPQLISWAELLPEKSQEEQYANISEPKTLAQIRLDGGAKDNGAANGARLYKTHKVKIKNQWINPLQSVNSGWGNAHLSGFIYQPVDYYQCYKLAQDPMFNKIFNILSKTPFANGGNVAPALNDEEQKSLEIGIRDFNVMGAVVDAVRSNYVCGGCLVYMDFGLDDLTEPLDLNKIDMRDFKGFRHIDPINVTAVDVNSTEPARGDYMEPETWYIIGLGNVHKSHLLKFEDNVPELIMRPMCMYLGMPLTQLIKQDIANSNLASQGLANLLNRFRLMYLRAPSTNFIGDGARNFRQRLEAMSALQDNFDIFALMQDEDMQQFTTSVAGLNECVEFFYQIISAKTDITMSILMGKGASGLSGTLEGERKNFYDRLRNIQQAVKPNLLKMLGIVYGAINDGKFRKFEDYIYDPLEQSTEKEVAENIRSYAEVGKSLVELGASNQDVMEWLKGFKDFHLDNVEIDTETQGLESYEGEEQESGNDEEESPENALKIQNDWITVHPHGKEIKGNPVFVGEGESKIEAIERRFGKGESGKKEEPEIVAYKEKRDEFVKKFLDYYEINPIEWKKGGNDHKDDILLHQLITDEEIGNFSATGMKNKTIKLGRELKKINKLLDERREREEKNKQYEEKLKEQKKRDRENKKTAKEFNVIKELPYSVYIERQGKLGWVPKKRINEKGELTAAGARLFDETAINKEIVEKENTEREKGVELPEKPNAETDLAFGYDVPVTIERKVYSSKTHDYYYPLTQAVTRIFIPKSLIKDGKAPAWVVEEKLQKAGDRFYKGSSDGFEPIQHGKVKKAFGKKAYTEQGRLRLAFTKEYEEQIKPDPDFEY